LLLLGGREAAGEGDSKGKRERVREGGILLLPLKLPDLGGASARRSVSGKALAAAAAAAEAAAALAAELVATP
jgi:hypothetical protein